MKTGTILDPLAEIQRFVEQAEPIAEANSKTAYFLGSEHEDALFGYCADFCEECAWLVANRVSCTLDLAYGWLAQQRPQIASALWVCHSNWMGLNSSRDWLSTCEIYPRQDHCSDGIQHCDNCHTLLNGYEDPSSSKKWNYWDERVKDGETSLDASDIAYLYYLLHESSDFSEDSRNALRRGAELLQTLDLSSLSTLSTHY